MVMGGSVLSGDRLDSSFYCFSREQTQLVDSQVKSVFAGPANLPLLQYFLYKSKGLWLEPGELMKVENVHEVRLEMIALSVAVEAIDANMISYSLTVTMDRKYSFEDVIDVAAVVYFNKKSRTEKPDGLVLQPQSSLEVLDLKKGSLELKFNGLTKHQEYTFEARLCIIFNNMISCNPTTVPSLFISDRHRRHHDPGCALC